MDAGHWVAVALMPVLLALGYGVRWVLDWYLGWREKRQLELKAEHERRLAEQKQEHDQQKEDRLGALNEWKEAAHRAQEYSDARQREFGEKLAAQDAKLAAIEAKAAACEKDRAAEAVRHAEAVGELKVKNAELVGQVQLVQASVRRLQVATGGEAPAVVSAAIVVADLDGVIRLASPSVIPLLHWMPADLIRKSVEVLIPERLRDRHRAGLAKVKATGEQPWEERTLAVHALTGDGREVPVTVALSAFSTAREERLVSAEITRRYAAPATAP